MSRPILKSLQRAYHAVLPEEARLRLYDSSPAVIRKQMDRWSTSMAPPPPLPFDSPTDEDIYYCYRLLIRREPQDWEIAIWRQHIDKFGFDLDRLVHELLHSDEYVEKEARLNEPYLVELELFKLYVRLNDYAIGAPIARSRSYEPALSRELQHILSPGKTFVDVGANIGYFTMLAASVVGPQGKVVAYEPNPANGQLIRLSLAANQFENTVTYHQAAVGAENGVLELLLRGTYSNARLLTDQSHKLPSQSTVQVPVVTLDETLSACETVDLIKIDVEGAEALVWQGMQAIVERHHPVLALEYFPDFIRMVSNVEPTELLAAIVDRGYDLYHLDDEVGKKPGGPFSAQQVAELQKQLGAQLINLLAVPHNSRKNIYA